MKKSTHQSSAAPIMDIQSPTSAHQQSKKIVKILSIVLCILAGVLIGLYIKQRYDYNQYIQTPEGQLQVLQDISEPVTTTPEEQAAELDRLSKSSTSVTTTSEEQLKKLEMLDQ